MVEQQYLIIKGRMYKAAHDFIVAGAKYYRTQHTDSYSTETHEATENYRRLAIPYQNALDDCEAFIRASKRDDLMDEDLQHILTFQRALVVIINHLDKKLLAWALLKL